LPLVIAGDLFDRWDAPAELINFALAELPNTAIYAVPGQHDLPHHRYEDLKKTAYWTLVAAGRMRNIRPGVPEPIDGAVLWGFPWGTPLTPLTGKLRATNAVNLAVVHRYLWRVGHTYPDAPADESLDATRPFLRGFGAAVFGDNHQGFYAAGDGETANVYNHGAFLRRRADERHLRPTAGVLGDDGTVRVVELDTRGDLWDAPPELPAGLARAGIDAGDLIKLLETAADGVVSFREAAMRHLAGASVSAGVRGLLLEWLENK
jgi:hypothetical protein